MNQALAALGVNMEETFGQDDVENGNVDRVGPLRKDRVSSGNNVDKLCLWGLKESYKIHLSNIVTIN